MSFLAIPPYKSAAIPIKPITLRRIVVIVGLVVALIYLPGELIALDLASVPPS